jgi:hypothetical protein
MFLLFVHGMSMLLIHAVCALAKFSVLHVLAARQFSTLHDVQHVHAAGPCCISVPHAYAIATFPCCISMLMFVLHAYVNLHAFELET